MDKFEHDSKSNILFGTSLTDNTSIIQTCIDTVEMILGDRSDTLADLNKIEKSGCLGPWVCVKIYKY